MGKVDIVPQLKLACFGCCYQIFGAGPVSLVLIAGTRHFGAVIMRYEFKDLGEALACVERVYIAAHRNLSGRSAN